MNRDSLFSAINRKIGKAIHRFQMIGEGDSILVAISGGKDSILLLEFLQLFQLKAPVKFQLIPVHVNQGGPFAENVTHVLSLVRERTGLDCQVVEEGIFSAISRLSDAGQTPCSLCGRLRRGVLMSTARRLGCNKIALGHHADDAMETLLMNAFFSGKIGSMSPHYRVGAGDLRIIRPLFLVGEDEVKSYVERSSIATVSCTFCQSSGGFKRREMKHMLENLQKHYPLIKGSLLASLSNIHVEEMADARFWAMEKFSLPDG